MATSAGHLIDMTGRAVGRRHQGVDEGGLSDSGVADENRGVPDEFGADRIDRHLAACTGEHPQIEPVEMGQERRGVGEVGLRDDEKRADAGIQSRHQIAVHQAGAGLGIGRGDDDEHLVGVGDDDPLDLIGVIGAAAQERRALDDADDAGQSPLRAGRIAHDACQVAGDDRRAAQFASAGRRDDPFIACALVDHDGVAAPVDAEHAPDLGVVVRGPALRARAVRLGVRTGADAALVEVLEVVVEVIVRVEPAHAVAPPGAVSASIRSHSAANSGSVLAVVPMSSMTTPGTRSPIRTPVVAMR